MFSGLYFYTVTLHEAIELIQKGVNHPIGTWADIGAGTGMFTLALMEILTEGKIIALDKSPHALYKIKAPTHVGLEIIDADFDRPLDLPELDGFVMANALHYAKDHTFALQNVLASLKPGGNFILIEYDTEIPNEPWVPNPISFRKFSALCKALDLNVPELIGTHSSIYSDGNIYSALLRG